MGNPGSLPACLVFLVFRWALGVLLSQTLPLGPFPPGKERNERWLRTFGERMSQQDKTITGYEHNAIGLSESLPSNCSGSKRVEWKKVGLSREKWKKMVTWVGIFMGTCILVFQITQYMAKEEELFSLRNMRAYEGQVVYFAFLRGREASQAVL